MTRFLARRYAAAAVLAATGALLAVRLAAAPAAVPPAPRRWVTDSAGFLSEGARLSLDARLEGYERQTGHQVLVWIARSTGDTPLEDFAVNAFKDWKVGKKGLDDGLAIFIFSDDRKIRIEVGYGLEDRIPDLVASRIIRETMAPRIQAGDRDGAVTAGVEAALAAIEGRAIPREVARPTYQDYRERGSGPARPLTAIQKAFIALAVIGFLLLLITHPSLAIWLLINLASGGRGGGGGGGDGGFSGGGGRSGGGGASGSW